MTSLTTACEASRVLALPPLAARTGSRMPRSIANIGTDGFLCPTSCQNRIKQRIALKWIVNQLQLTILVKWQVSKFLGYKFSRDTRYNIPSDGWNKIIKPHVFCFFAYFTIFGTVDLKLPDTRLQLEEALATISRAVISTDHVPGVDVDRPQQHVIAARLRPLVLQRHRVLHVFQVIPDVTLHRHSAVNTTAPNTVTSEMCVRAHIAAYWGRWFIQLGFFFLIHRSNTLRRIEREFCNKLKKLSKANILFFVGTIY